MFGPNGNPQARNLFEIISRLQKHEGLHLKVQSVFSFASPTGLSILLRLLSCQT